MTLRAQIASRGIETNDGLTASAFRDFETRGGVRMTAEMEDYFSVVDGMIDSRMDPETYLHLWRLDQVAAASEAPENGSSPGIEYFIFADFLLWSHAYGVRLDEQRREASEVAMLTSSEPVVVARSLSEFLKGVVSGNLMST